MTLNATRSFVCSIALMGALFVSGANAQAPDNTKANKDARPTADQAKENQTDRQLMQKIRKAIVAEKSFSTNAKNVKVIAEHGKVTLKGPVNTEAEKTLIEAKAVEVAGAANVVNEITVKGDTSK
jgi:hyperosmotically inducible protein